jgi:uncharacterized repeat protein (TIGR04052 family)
MRRVVCWIATLTCVLVGAQACGDDDEPAADGGSDTTDAGRGGKGGSAGKAGASAAGKGGSGGASPAGKGGSGGAGGSAGGEAATQAVTIKFKAKIGDADLECGKSYPGQGSSKVSATPQDFRMFVEDVRLLTSDGTEARVVFDERAPSQTKDVALLDFTDRQGKCTAGAATVNTTITGKVVPGEYTGVVFVNGVPETLNHQNLTQAKPPLQDASTYWGWQSGYRFIMTGLITDAAPSGGDGADDAGPASTGANFVHIGSGGCADAGGTAFTCDRANRTRVKLDDFDVATNTIVADLGKVFENIDLTEAIECHGPAPECRPAYVAFGVDLDNGMALDTQSVFRVE